MGRAIIRDPALFLMDEPMSNLDAKLRSQARADMVRLQRRLGTTTLFVTHDQVEAMAIGDRIGLMRGGRLVQCGPPMELYDHPVDVFVARFIGSPPMSLVEAQVVETDRGPGLRIGSLDVELGEAGRSRCPGLDDRIGASVVLGLRADALHRDADGPLVASVESTELLGSEQLVRARIDARPMLLTAAGIEVGEAPATVHVSVTPHDEVSLWRPFRLRPDPEAFHLFDPESGCTLR
jgi:multiple sugar transport system ATP-binding protein